MAFDVGARRDSPGPHSAVDHSWEHVAHWVYGFLRPDPAVVSIHPDPIAPKLAAEEVVNDVDADDDHGNIEDFTESEPEVIKHGYIPALEFLESLSNLLRSRRTGLPALQQVLQHAPLS